MRGSREREVENAIRVYVLHFRALGLPFFSASWTGLDDTESVDPEIADRETFYKVDSLSESGREF
jgi:hypothetical protein